MNMRRMLFLVSLILLLLSSTALIAEDFELSDFKGPLSSRNLYPMYTPFMNLTPDAGQLLPSGTVEISLQNLYTNVFVLDDHWVTDEYYIKIDMEVYLMTLSFDWALDLAFEGDTNWMKGNFLQLGADISFISGHGGFMDPLIEGFHNLLGLPNANREVVSDNQFRFQIDNNQGTIINEASYLSGISNITLRARLGILNDRVNHFALALESALKIPAQPYKPVISSGGTDFAFRVLMTKVFFPFAFHINTSYVYLTGPSEIASFNFFNHLFDFLVSIEWYVDHVISLFFQIDGNTSPYQSGNLILDSLSAQFYLGLQWEFTENAQFEFSFAEEFFSSAATDILFNASVSVKF